jgi:hypothetical protein
MKNTAPLFVFAGLFLAACVLTTPSKNSTSESTPTAVPIHTAETVLKRVAETVCPPPKDPADRDPYQRQYESFQTKFTFFCSPAAGHGTNASLRWFASTDEAHTEFEIRRKQATVEDFHGYPLAVMEEDYSGFTNDRKEYRICLWQAGQWPVEVRAFDDTPNLIAPAPEEVSEEIYRVGKEMGLFSQ